MYKRQEFGSFSINRLQEATCAFAKQIYAFIDFVIPVSYTHLNSGMYANNYMILFELTAVIVRHGNISLVTT